MKSKNLQNGSAEQKSSKMKDNFQIIIYKDKLDKSEKVESKKGKTIVKKSW